MYTADTAFTVSAFSFCLFGFFWKPTEHISILSVTLWGDLTAVSTAAFSFASKSLLFSVPKVRDIIRQACLPPHAEGHTGKLAVLHELHRSFTFRLFRPDRFWRKYPYPDFHRLQGWLPLLTILYFSLAAFTGHGVQRSRLTSSSPVIGI